MIGEKVEMNWKNFVLTPGSFKRVRFEKLPDSESAMSLLESFLKGAPAKQIAETAQAFVKEVPSAPDAIYNVGS